MHDNIIKWRIHKHWQYLLQTRIETICYWAASSRDDDLVSQREARDLLLPWLLILRLPHRERERERLVAIATRA